MNEENKHDMTPFLTVAEGVTLVRFASKEYVKLVARRVGTSGTPNSVFEIYVDRASRFAIVTKDERELFRIAGTHCRYSLVEELAVSALHRWFTNQRKRCARRRRAIKARKMISESGDSGKPQYTLTNAPESDALLLMIETTGRSVGGDCATISVEGMA